MNAYRSIVESTLPNKAPALAGNPKIARALLAMPILLAASLPVVSCHFIGQSHEQVAAHLFDMALFCIWTAVPFAVLALLRIKSLVGQDSYIHAVSAGLLTATLTWGWVTLDGMAFPSTAGNPISHCYWIAPAILCAMLASTRLNKATAL